MTTNAMDLSADINSYFEVKDNPLFQAGVFPYRWDECPGAAPDDDCWLFVSAEEIGSPETIESFRLVPLVDEHPEPNLGREADGYVPPEEWGVHGCIGEDVYFKDGTLYGNLKIFSQSLADMIESGKRELSIGYTCKRERATGVFNGQPYNYLDREIRGNHVALVAEGACGSEVAVMDGVTSGRFTITLDTSELAKQHAGTFAFETRKSEPMTIKSYLRERAARDRLAARLTPHLGTFDHSAMTVGVLELYAIARLGLKAKKGQEAAVLNGYLQSQALRAPAAPAEKENFVTRYLNNRK
jgi:hypothetical protein